MVNNIAYLRDIYDSHDYTVPRIHVSNQTEVITREPGKSGTVVIIGAFPDYDKSIKCYNSYKSIINHYGISAGDEAETAFNGLRAAKQICSDSRGYVGANEIYICNITEVQGDTESGSAEIGTITSDPDEGTYADKEESKQGFDASKYDTNLTFTRLQNALNRLYGEVFDLLFIADTFDHISEGDEKTNKDGSKQKYTKKDAYQTCEDFLSSEFQMQRPSQIVAPLVTNKPTPTVMDAQSNTSTTIDYDEAKEYAALFERSVFNYAGLYTQSLYLNGRSEKLDIIESAAYMCGYIASLNVGSSLTFRTIPGVSGVAEELYVGPNDDGYKLTQIGLPIIVNKVRNTQEYCVLNSRTPSGYDIGQIRAVSYLIKQYNLQQYLGLPNDAQTRAQIAADMEIVNQRVLSEVSSISSVDTSNIIVPTREDGTPLPQELYIELNVVVYGVLILIDLGVNMTEDGGAE